MSSQRQRQRSKVPWFFLGLLAFVGACTISSRSKRGPKPPKQVYWSTFCPGATSEPVDSIQTETADREEYDPRGGLYYAYWDCGNYHGVIGQWRVTFYLVFKPNLGVSCWEVKSVDRLGECV